MEQLKRLRAEKGLSQARLAARAEVDPSTVNQIERGAREASPATIRKLAEALGVRIAELLEEEAPKGRVSLPFEEAEQRRYPFVESWTSYTLRRAREWRNVIPEGVREAANTSRGFEKLFTSKPGLAFEILHRNEGLQAEATMLFESVNKVIDDAQRYGNYREPAEEDFARWREEQVGFREFTARMLSGGQADLKELVWALFRAHDAAEEWMHVTRAARDATDRETSRPAAELELLWEKSERDAEERRKVVALFDRQAA